MCCIIATLLDKRKPIISNWDLILKKGCWAKLKSRIRMVHCCLTWSESQQRTQRPKRKEKFRVGCFLSHTLTRCLSVSLLLLLLFWKQMPADTQGSQVRSVLQWTILHTFSSTDLSGAQKKKKADWHVPTCPRGIALVFMVGKWHGNGPGCSQQHRGPSCSHVCAVCRPHGKFRKYQPASLGGLDSILMVFKYTQRPPIEGPTVKHMDREPPTHLCT